MTDRPHLILCDLDDTLIEGFLGEVDGELTRTHPYERVEPLPNRRQTLDRCRAVGIQVMIVSNQGGVAFGHQTLDQVHGKLFAAMVALGFDETDLWIEGERHAAALSGADADTRAQTSALIAVKHPSATVESYRCDPDDTWRKPGGGMLTHAMKLRGVAAENTLMVGDLPSDAEAAAAAGVAYVDTDDFFAPGRARVFPT